jgi:hypothetical protein
MDDDEPVIRLKKTRQKLIESTTPPTTQEEMYQLILNLTERVVMLENMLQPQQQQQQQQQNKKNMSKRNHKPLNMSEWLKRLETPEMTYKEWLQQIQVNQENIQLLFTDPTNLPKVIENILKRDLKKPWVSVPDTYNMYYVYNEDEKQRKSWTKLTQNNIDILLKTILQRISRELIIWREQNEDKLKQDDVLYDSYSKIMTMVFSTITNKCQKTLWNKIYENF